MEFVVLARAPALKCVVALALSQAACFAAPFVLPPVHVSGHGGGSFGSALGPPAPSAAPGNTGTAPPAPATAAPVLRTTNGTAGVRASVHPMQFNPGALRRSFDVGLGYSLDALYLTGGGDVLWHGPYAEVEVQPFVLSRDPTRGPRLTFFGTLELLRTTANGINDWGGGTSAGARLEIVDFAHGPFAGAGASEAGLLGWAGAAHGEGGVGVELMASARMMNGEPVVTATIGLTVRMPAAIGVVGGIVNPLVFLSGGRGGSGSSGGSSTGGGRSSSGGGSGGGSSGGPRAGTPSH